MQNWVQPFGLALHNILCGPMEKMPTPALTLTLKLVHAFISSQLDYCNAIFAGLTTKQTPGYLKCNYQSANRNKNIWSHIPSIKITPLAPSKAKIDQRIDLKYFLLF